MTFEEGMTLFNETSMAFAFEYNASQEWAIIRTLTSTGSAPGHSLTVSSGWTTFYYAVDRIVAATETTDTAEEDPM